MTETSAAPQGSLRVRMVLSASLVLAVFLGVVGLVLDNAYRQSAEQSVSERLLLHIYALISATVEEPLQSGFTLYLPEESQEPQLNVMSSGLYGLLVTTDGEEIWRSRSALDLSMTQSVVGTLIEGARPGVVQFGELAESETRDALFYMTYPVIWQSEAGENGYVYLVLQDFGPYSNEVATFRGSLWGWLIAGVLVLACFQAGILYWGLRPLSGLEQDLKAIEEGREAYLGGRYPSEISGVTRSLNLLLASEREQRERYRTSLADLAHSLKTPLAILKAEAHRLNDADRPLQSVDEQVDRMNEIVSYQLERAVTSASSLVRQTTSIAPAVEKLTLALTRVYLEKSVNITSSVSAADFSGDERDLMEILGNLLDNACKYGNGKVYISSGCHGDGIQLLVEDDGPGIAISDRARVLERGTRLDSREAGQGIGLAVVAEIVARYGGGIEIGNSEILGGAKITVTLP